MAEDEVPVRGPVALMRPRPAAEVPAEGAMRGGVRYELKMDGFRAAALIDAETVRLVSRSGNPLGPRFPGLLSALSALPAGVVLDGEVVASVGGRVDFNALLRVTSRRVPAGVALTYVAFDVLWGPGGVDVRRRPLRERVELLAGLLAVCGPQVQPVLATTDRETALAWYEGLAASGIEGLVCKALDSPYDPRAARAWVKVRHAATADGLVVGIVGMPRRPTAAVVELEGRRVLTSPELDALAARALADAVRGHVGEPQWDARLEVMVSPVVGGPVVEVRRITGRHGTVAFVRVRPRDI